MPNDHSSASVDERFWQYVEERGDCCWPWLGATQKAYGTIYDQRVKKLAGGQGSRL